MKSKVVILAHSSHLHYSGEKKKKMVIDLERSFPSNGTDSYLKQEKDSRTDTEVRTCANQERVKTM